jgi:serine phosphatase RsbU (regulator of sigma subunit)
MTALKMRIEPPSGVAIERDCPEGTLTFGRSTEADVVISDGSMSRRHAQIVAEQGAWLVEDLGARNGTYVNGERIDGRRPLVAGDVIQMGGTRVVVHAGEPPTPKGALGLGELGSSIFRSVADLAEAEAKHLAPARAAARLKALNDFHRALAGPVALDALLELLLERLFAVLHAEEGLILLRQADGSMKTAASRRLPGATGELVVSRRLTEEIVGKDTAALVSDVAMDGRFTGAESMIGAGIRSILAAPISDAGGCLGMVAVYSRATVRRFGEEDLELLVSLASAAALRIRNVALADEAAERRVHDRELALAHDIQMGMLPRAIPHRSEVQLAASLTPARSVGGDLYDFYVTDRWLWFVVADAAGKGVSAALYMAVTRTLFRALARASATVSEVTSRMNAELARDNDAQFFVTAFVGRLDLTTGELRYCNAGHPLPLLVPAASSPRALEGPEGSTALGIMEDLTYQEKTARLAAGDLILAFSDGVTEAVDPTGRMFSDQQLHDVVARRSGQAPQQLVNRVVESVKTFAAEAPQEDDITVLAVQFQP